MVANALHLANLGVADPQQIDMAWKVGTHLDAGPFEILDNMGADLFKDNLSKASAAGFIDTARHRSAAQYLASNQKHERS